MNSEPGRAGRARSPHAAAEDRAEGLKKEKDAACAGSREKLEAEIGQLETRSKELTATWSAEEAEIAGGPKVEEELGEPILSARSDAPWRSRARLGSENREHSARWRKQIADAEKASGDGGGW